jgi:hypothetical protein
MTVTFVVFCFSKPEDPEAFSKHFGGERLPENSDHSRSKLVPAVMAAACCRSAAWRGG